MWTINNFFALACYLDRVHMEKRDVRVIWHTQKHLLWKVVGKVRGLTVTVGFYLETMNLEEIRILLKKEKKKQTFLPLGYHQLMYGIMFMTFQNSNIMVNHARFQDTGTHTIGQKEVFFGT